MNAVTQAVASLESAIGARDLVAFLLRLTLVVALGRLVLAATPRASAATRHLIATATLGVALLLPFATALLPEWRLAILPSEPAAESASSASLETAAHSQARIAPGYDGRALAPPATAPRTATSGTSIARGLLALPLLPITWPFALALLAIGVSELLLARFALSLLTAAIFTRRAREVCDSRVRHVFERAKVRIGVRRSVGLRVTSRVSVPVVSGLMRPALLLPAEAEAWDSDRLEIVFLHELAHVKRQDLVGLVLAKTAAAVYWFHPFVWTLERDARRECERACDDEVLRSGVRASDYAEILLVVARRAAARAPGHGAVLAIAGHSSLERRLRSILSAGARREGSSRRAAALAALLAALVLVPLATVRVTAAPARPAPKPRPQAERAAEPIPAPADPAPEYSSTISGSEWYARAQRFYERERYGAAARAYERAARGGYQIAKSLYNAACSHALDDQPDQALAQLEKSVEAGWTEIDLIRSDDDLDSIRDDPRFDRILDRARSIDPGDARQTTARAEFEALRSAGSSDADAWGSVGRTLLRSDEPALAAQAFEKQIGLDASSSTAIYNLACAQAQNHETAEALATLERAILAGYGDADHMREDDDLAPLRRQRRFGELTRMTEEFELDLNILASSPRHWREDLPRYEKTTRTYPRAGRAWFNLGYAQLRGRRPEAARASFQRSLGLEYRPATTMYNLACSSAQLHDLDGAMRWLEKAEDSGMKLENYAPRDRDLYPLRSDPRYRALMRRLEERKRDSPGSKFRRLLDKM